MNGLRYLGVGTLFAVAGAVLAEPDPVVERAEHLQRDQQLIQALVYSGMRLAVEDDALRRADHCNHLAELLAKEIKRTMNNKEAAHSAELSGHMHALLVRGVAGNLAIAMLSAEPNSPRELELNKLGVEIFTVAKSIEDELSKHPELELEYKQSTLKSLANCKTEIESVLKGKGKKGKF